MVPIKDSPQLVLRERLRGVCELWYVDLITRLVGAPATLMRVFVYIYVHVRVTFGVPDFYLKQGLSHFLGGGEGGVFFWGFPPLACALL